MSSSSLPFQPSCPSGGAFFACATGSRFVGCCTETNPCDSTGCASGNLKPASFLASAYGTFPDQECSAGLWYSCTGTKPPFFGCCKVNACQAGCGDSNLAAGYLSSNPSIAGPYLGTSGSASASVASATTSLATTASVTPATTSPAGTSKASNIGPIAGGAAAGGVVFVALIIFLLFFCNRRRKAAKGFGRSVPATGQTPMGQQKLGAHEPYQTPPPTYSFDNSSPSRRPPSPSYAISEIDGTPLLPFSSDSSAPTNNAFSPPPRAYSSELPTPETDARAEMEGDSPAKRMKSARRTGLWAGKASPLSEGMMRQQNRERRGGSSSERQGDGEGAGLGIWNHHQ